jgi:thiopeptide-type bacteriocin biosynthesis protein
MAFAGPSTISLVGRFGYGDAELLEAAQQLVADEQKYVGPDVVLATLAYLPQGRASNVVRGPVLRDYYIDPLGILPPSEKEIRLSTCTVELTGGRLVLRSSRFNSHVEILPRLDNAFNHRLADVPLFRFLCDLQYQQQLDLNFRWGPFLDQLPFLPRVTWKNVVISLARWTLRLSAANKPLDCAGLRRFAEDNAVPPVVNLREGDNVLPVQINDDDSANAALQLINRNRGAVFEEVFCPADEHFVRGPEGHFACELVIPFLSAVGDEKKRAVSLQVPRQSEYRREAFAPSDDWVYFKIVAVPRVIDRLLSSTVVDLVRSLFTSELIERWFFVRYADPDWHLRLRFQIKSKDAFANLCQQVVAAFRRDLDFGRVVSIGMDTYFPEVGRYGGKASLELAHGIFWADSDCALQAISRTARDGTRGDMERWLQCIAMLDSVLSAFAMDESTRPRFLHELAEGYLSEAEDPSAHRRRIGDIYRREKKNISSVLSSNRTGATPHFSNHYLRCSSLAREIALLDRQSQLTVPVDQVIVSFLHMTCNRMLVDSQRSTEPYLYELLARSYRAPLEAPRELA